MAFRDSFVEQFDTGDGVIGYKPDGSIWVDREGPAGSAPIFDAIWGVQDPGAVADAVADAQAGGLAAPAEVWGEVAGIIVEPDGVRAELDLPDDSYTQQLSFAEFAPILSAWQAAWAGAQAHRAESSASVR